MFLTNKFGLGFLLSRMSFFKTRSTRVSWNIFVSKFLLGYRKKVGLFFFNFFSLIFFLRRSLNFVESISCLNLPLFCYSPKFVEGRRVFKNFFFFKKWVKGFLTSFTFMEDLKIGVLPAAILCLNTKKYNEIFISEAMNLNVPVVGLFDVSSFGLNFFSYLVPSNYTLENQLFYLRLFLRSYLVGYKSHLLRFFQEICAIPRGQGIGIVRPRGLRKLIRKIKYKFKKYFKSSIFAERSRRSLLKRKRNSLKRKRERNLLKRKRERNLLKRKRNLFKRKRNFLKRKRNLFKRKRILRKFKRKLREKKDSRILSYYRKFMTRALARKSKLAYNFSFNSRKFYKFKIFLFNPLTSIFKNKFLHKSRKYKYSKFKNVRKLKILFRRPKYVVKKRRKYLRALRFNDYYSRASKLLILRQVRRRARRRPFLLPFLVTRKRKRLSPALLRRSGIFPDFMYGVGDSLVNLPFNKKSIISDRFLSRCKFLGAFSKNLGFAFPRELGLKHISVFPYVAPILNKHSLDIPFYGLVQFGAKIAKRLYLDEAFSFTKFFFFLLLKRFSSSFKSRFIKEFSLKFFDRSVSTRFFGITISRALRRNQFYFRRFFRGLRLYRVLFIFSRYSKFLANNAVLPYLCGVSTYRGDFLYSLFGFFRAFLLLGKNCVFLFFRILHSAMPGKYSVVKSLARLVGRRQRFFRSIVRGPYRLQHRLIGLIIVNFGLNRNLKLKSSRQSVNREFNRKSCFFNFFLSSLEK